MDSGPRLTKGGMNVDWPLTDASTASVVLTFVSIVIMALSIVGQHREAKKYYQGLSEAIAGLATAEERSDKAFELLKGLNTTLQGLIGLLNEIIKRFPSGPPST